MLFFLRKKKKRKGKGGTFCNAESLDDAESQFFLLSFNKYTMLLRILALFPEEIQHALNNYSTLPGRPQNYMAKNVISFFPYVQMVQISNPLRSDNLKMAEIFKLIIFGGKDGVLLSRNICSQKFLVFIINLKKDHN